MNDAIDNAKVGGIPGGSKVAKISQCALQVVGGAVPIAGGVLSVIADLWSGHEQKKATQFIEHWLQMLTDELKEKEQTIIEIMARLDLQDEAI